MTSGGKVMNLAGMEKEKNDRSITLRKLHSTVFCQVFSPCGKYLITGDNFGTLAVLSLQSALAADATDSSWRPVYTFKAHKGAIYTLASTSKFLISGGTDNIQGWHWSDVTNTNEKKAKVAWALTIPKNNKFDFPETNSIALDIQDWGTKLYAGCGNNKVHCWDLESGTETLQLSGHSEYVHSVKLRSNGQECVSGSEDGTVRIWDSRTGTEVGLIEPYKNDQCARPHIGKWVGCLAVDPAEDWMICGGGPHLSLWHLRSLCLMTCYELPNTVHQDVLLYEDTVISGGNESQVYHWSTNGELRSKVPCTPSSVFSIAVNTNSNTNKVLSVGGNCHKVDICVNFQYKSFSMDII